MKKAVFSRPFSVISKTKKVLFVLAFTVNCQLMTERCLSFELPKHAVYPRIFSPNGDGVNDVVYFEVVNPSLETMEGRILDGTGSLVADLKAVPAVPPPSGDPDAEMWVWDGKDGNGVAVRTGVYVYEMRGGGKTVTGRVVVAK